MTTRIIHTKSPDAVLDFGFDWKALTNGTDGGESDWLVTGETISSHTVTAYPAGLTVDSSTESSGKVTAWLSGGTAGKDYQVTCKIVTSAGRTDTRAITVRVRER